ncbi:hypothetical protein BCR43DRAFT_565912 [Syncephalastrum racemosum]|uniref:C3H1-type domain-containing protein n=1 Tax=Syncephalastrum racemosum TaxID=13706 RepID=A0A1X2H4H7_SYNRA|nr:hypothetical protein BCR43DRAFT_565912 [Syncephalastrum racemosum]
MQLTIEQQQQIRDRLAGFLANFSDADPPELADLIVSFIQVDKSLQDLPEYLKEELEMFLTEDLENGISMIVETIRQVTAADSVDTSETNTTDRKRKASEGASEPANDVPSQEEPSTKRRHTEEVIPEVEDVLDDITGADDTLVGHEQVPEEQPAPVVPSSPASKPESVREDEMTRQEQPPQHDGTQESTEEEERRFTEEQLQTINALSEKLRSRLRPGRRHTPSIHQQQQQHNEQRIPQQRLPCRNLFTRGFCSYGPTCKFEHDPTKLQGFNMQAFINPNMPMTPVINPAMVIPPQQASLVDPKPFTTQYDQNSTAIVVENVPKESLQIDILSDTFKEFGTVIDIKLQPEFSRAFLRYQNHEDALKAFQSSNVFFNNRFVKVFWHKHQPRPAQPSSPAKPAQSTPPDPELIKKRAEEIKKQQEINRQKKQLQMAALHKQKQELLERQIAEHKALLQKMEAQRKSKAQEQQ